MESTTIFHHRYFLIGLIFIGCLGTRVNLLHGGEIAASDQSAPGSNRGGLTSNDDAAPRYPLFDPASTQRTQWNANDTIDANFQQRNQTHSIREFYPPSHLSRDELWRQFATTPPEAGAGAPPEGYESVASTLRNGFWFGGVDLMFLEPVFQSNQAFAIQTATGASASHVDFGFDLTPNFYLGFETNSGPGWQLSAWRINDFSSISSFVSDGTSQATLSIGIGDVSNSIDFSATSAGDELHVQQQFKLLSTEFLVYKDLKNPRSRVRGNAGLRYVSLKQRLLADLNEPAAGTTSIRNSNDIDALGPKIGIEYFRPVGHTRLEIQSGLFASLLIGRRDQTTTCNAQLHFQQLGKLEPLTVFDLYGGLQWNIQTSRCRRVYFRGTIESQLWINGDSAIDLATDFGLYGFTAGLGVTR